MTSSVELSFAKASILRHDMVEIAVNPGVEVTVSMTEEWESFIKTHLSIPILVLLNKVNKYSYSFQAQMRIAKFDFVKAVAVVNYNAIGRFITDAVLGIFPLGPSWPIEQFSGRDSALAWLMTFSANRQSSNAAD